MKDSRLLSEARLTEGGIFFLNLRAFRGEGIYVSCQCFPYLCLLLLIFMKSSFPQDVSPSGDHASIDC